MTMHNNHDEPWQDDCPRCREWADDPFTRLDADNLHDLYLTTVQFMKVGCMEERATDTRMRAIRKMERHLINERHLTSALRFSQIGILNPPYDSSEIGA